MKKTKLICNEIPGKFSTNTAHSVKSLSVITTLILHQEGLAALKTVIISAMAAFVSEVVRNNDTIHSVHCHQSLTSSTATFRIH